MGKNIDNIVYSKNVLEFTTVANEYCSFIEKAYKGSQKDFFVKIQKILPLLYLKASLLPELKIISSEGSEKFVSLEEWELINNNIKLLLSDFDTFKEVYDPLMQEEEDSSSVSIAENIADIYQDLKDYVSLYNIGSIEMMNDAICECKNNFKKYWGQRLVNILRPIHHIVYGDKKLNTDVNTETKKRDKNSWNISQQFENLDNDE
ncbi:MAG: DUF5063 domain-containing protein [Bacteroidetes bacterium]|nr:MAG: DUF5063 domain-containing protein [Bacteroidota bacterium]